MVKRVLLRIRDFFKNKITRRVLRYTGNVILAILIVLVCLSVYGNIQRKGRDWVAPTVGSYRWLTVLSGSMQPVFNPGDLIIDKKIDAAELKAGDVITYMYGMNFLSTHRITEVTKDKNNNLAFKTKGDNNNTADEQLVPANAVVGKYVFRIPYLGLIMEKLKGLPAVIGIWLLFLYIAGTEIYKSIRKQKKEKPEEVKAES